MMIRQYAIVFILVCLVGVSCTSGAVVQSGPDYSKFLQIHVTYQGSSYSISSMQVNYGKSPNLDLRTGILSGKILDPDGRVLKSFSILEPGLSYGDMPAPDGGGLIGFTGRPVNGETAITLPYMEGMKTFSLTDSRDGSVLLLTDLEVPITQFCTSYPGDPDCLARISSVPAATPAAFPYGIPAILLLASILVAAGLAFATIRGRPVRGVSEKETILVVDDEPEVVGLLKNVLGRKGYRIQTATSGEECLESMKKEIPDLILLDVMMEPMDGWQTLEQIRKNPGAQFVPVVMLTANQLTAAEAKKYRICIDDYIMKPWEPDELDSAVEYFLERKRKLKHALQLTSRAGVEKDKVCEFARLDRRISANRKIVDILRQPLIEAERSGPEAFETLAVADDINSMNRAYEKQITQLRQEINTSLVSHGLPELAW